MDSLSIKDRWDNLGVGIKLISLLCIATAFVQLFLESIVKYLPNDLPMTVDNLEIWRLFTSFLINGSGVMLIFNLPLSIYMLLLSAPDIVSLILVRNGDTQPSTLFWSSSCKLFSLISYLLLSDILFIALMSYKGIKCLALESTFSFSIFYGKAFPSIAKGLPKSVCFRSTSQ